MDDLFLLHVVQSQRSVIRHWYFIELQRVCRDRIAFGMQHRHAHDPFQFPHVAAPCISEQLFSRFRVKAFHLTVKFLVGEFQEEISQRHDVLTTLTQRRYVQCVFLYPMEQILAETLFCNGCLQVLVCSSDDAHVCPLVLAASRGSVPFGFQCAEQHLLHFRRKVAYLVEEQCASCGFFPEPLFLAFGSCERSFLMPEQGGGGKFL